MTQTQLDRRRDQSAAAKTAAEQARTAVTDLANRLQTNADLTAQQELALRNAEAETKRLKRSLKTQARDRDRLAKAHQKAQAKAAKASRRADDLDDKYSKSVLADMVRREKERDQAASMPARELTPVPEKAVAAAAESPARATAARATTARAAKTASSSTGRTGTARTGTSRTGTGRATKATSTRTRRS